MFGSQTWFCCYERPNKIKSLHTSKKCNTIDTNKMTASLISSINLQLSRLHPTGVEHCSSFFIMSSTNKTYFSYGLSCPHIPLLILLRPKVTLSVCLSFAVYALTAKSILSSFGKGIGPYCF